MLGITVQKLPNRFCLSSPKSPPISEINRNYRIIYSPFAPLRENKEFKADAPSGHGVTAALC